MIVIAGLVLGALVGALRARARQGNRLDIAQYAAVHAMIFAVIGLFVTIALDRLV
ncbi:MAG: hypothetical protein H5U19_05370 [Rhodobacteraceae bacterium]|jgi:hypothetical protein|nr:hypothetical protein [Paracoccaceae bacterium]